MAVGTGYSKVATSGLVFAYDAADSFNSYKGEPTTNYWNGNPFSIYNSGATNVRNSTDVAPPVSGYEVVKVTADSIGSYGQCILWNATYPNNNVATITNSIYAYLTVGDYVQVGQHWWPWYYGEPQYITKNQWVRIASTYTINEGNSYGNAALTYSTNGIAYFAMPQYEYISHATPFIGANGTRSNTQGLLDLSGGGTTIPLNNSYDSNAMFYFDGTDDSVYIGYASSISNTMSRSWEVVVKPTSNASYGAVFGNKVGYDCSYHCDGGIYLWDGNWVFDWYDNSSYQFLYSSIPPVANQSVHIVGTYDASDQKPRIYVNGVLRNTYGSATNLNYGGATYVIDLGYNSSGIPHFFQGYVPVAKYYQNKALSATEVLQNFNHYKTRYNIT